MTEGTQKTMLSAWGLFQRKSSHLLFLWDALCSVEVAWSSFGSIDLAFQTCWGESLVVLTLFQSRREEDCASPCYHHETLDGLYLELLECYQKKAANWNVLPKEFQYSSRIWTRWEIKQTYCQFKFSKAGWRPHGSGEWEWVGEFLPVGTNK